MAESEQRLFDHHQGQAQMKKLRSLHSLLLLSVISTIPVVTAQTAADSNAITGFYREWFGAGAQGPQIYAGFYAQDGKVLPPGLPLAKGREAIDAWLRPAQASATYTTVPSGINVDELHFLSPTLVVYRSTLRGRRVIDRRGWCHRRALPLRVGSN
ncbi:MAG: hypothetical protein ACRENP_05585 [Longimicrobiales bacterium]